MISCILEGVGLGVDKASRVHSKIGAFVKYTGMTVEMPMNMGLLKRLQIGGCRELSATA